MRTHAVRSVYTHHHSGHTCAGIQVVDHVTKGGVHGGDTPPPVATRDYQLQDQPELLEVLLLRHTIVGVAS